MSAKCVDWEKRKEFYRQKGLRATNLCILEKAYDIVDKAIDSALCLKKLIEQYDVRF